MIFLTQCPVSPCNYLIVPANWEEGQSLTRLLEVVQTGVTKVEQKILIFIPFEI